MPDRTDREEVTAFLRTRDERAFLALYRRHTPYLFGLARKLCAGDDEAAADVVEEMWVRAVRSLETFAGRSALRSWLAGILVNCHRERRRDERRWLELSEDAVSSPADATPTRVAVEDALARLPAGYRDVIVLHDLYGHTHREVAEMLGIEEGTSKSQLARGRTRLKQLLE